MTEYIEFGIVKEYLDKPSHTNSEARIGIARILFKNGNPTGEELEFDGANGHIAYYDADEEAVDLLSGRLSEIFLYADMTPSAPEPEVEIAFERVASEQGDMIGRWTLAEVWRRQQSRIGMPPFPFDED